MTLAQQRQQLHDVLQRLVSPPDEQWQAFQTIFSPRQFAKGSFLAMEGECYQKCHFVCAGLIRFYYATPDGKEFNKSFLQTSDFAGSLASFLQKTPLRFTIQAMEETHTLEADLGTLRAFYDKHPCWERLGRIIAEQLALKKERRECAFLLDDAKTRYKQFLQDYPGLDQRIAQYHIASYLGITDVALSRIRRHMKETHTAMHK